MRLLAPGNEGSVGSPASAGAGNVSAIPVDLLDDDLNVFGFFELDAGESVDVQLVPGPNDEDLLQLQVLVGEVTVTVFEQTQVLTSDDGPTTFSPDAEPPAIGAAPDVVAEATSPAGAVVHFDLPAVTDDFDPVPLVTASPASGSQFALGATPVTVTATDAAGNTATATFTVTVIDTTPPDLLAPDDLLLEATGPQGAVADFAATATDLVSTPEIAYSHAPGSTFPLGTTTVTATATDTAGNDASVTFRVTVEDTVAPALTVPNDLVVPCAELTAEGPGCAKVTDPAIGAWLASASATDVVDTAPVVTHDAPAVFPIGTTLVTFRATDASGNAVGGTARVQVVYQFGGFEPPLRGDGSASIQQGRQGRTVPVKFRLTCASGESVATAVASFAVYKVLDAATGTVDTTDLTADAGNENDGGNLFRYDAGSQQYIYNLSTQGWSAPATYRIIATLDDGTQHTVDFSLR